MTNETEQIREAREEYKWAEETQRDARAMMALDRLDNLDALPVKNPTTGEVILEVDIRRPTGGHGPEVASITLLNPDGCPECGGMTEVTDWHAPGYAESGGGHRCMDCGDQHHESTL